MALQAWRAWSPKGAMVARWHGRGVAAVAWRRAAASSGALSLRGQEGMRAAARGCATLVSVDAPKAPFRTTRLPSLLQTMRTVTGVEETAALLEELSSNVQQFAPTAESIARRLSPRAARELARALAADTGEVIARPPSSRTLFLLGLSSCVPFIGFGFVDNAIMIMAGDAVERSMMYVLPISTMAAAGMGNLMSDVCGVGLGGVIESFAAKLGIEPPPLTRAQQQLRVCRLTVHAGSAIGISIGCIIGMFPLLLLNRDEEEMHHIEHGGAASPHLKAMCAAAAGQQSLLAGTVTRYYSVDASGAVATVDRPAPSAPAAAEAPARPSDKAAAVGSSDTPSSAAAGSSSKVPCVAVGSSDEALLDAVSKLRDATEHVTTPVVIGPRRVVAPVYASPSSPLLGVLDVSCAAGAQDPTTTALLAAQQLAAVAAAVPQRTKAGKKTKKTNQ